MACLAPPGESPEAASGEGTGLPDVTVLLDDSRLGQCAEPPAREEPVLALVSLNPKTATSYNLRRGKIQVLPDIPLAPGAAGTHHIRCGRDPAHPMAIGDARVSLLHFTIRMRTAPDGSVTLDLMDQSSNGTWVNGQRVGQGKSVPLKVGDQILVLPAATVGRDAEVGYMLLHDARGAGCGSQEACGHAVPRASLRVSSPAAAAAPAAPAPPAPAPAAASGAGAVPQTLERDLRCGICADALWRCLTLVPCGHNFCTSCLVTWRRRSPVCPECRALMEQAVQNHSVDRVVEAFLLVNPDAARTPAEVEGLAKAGKDPQNMAVLRWLLRDKGAEELRRIATPLRANRYREDQYHRSERRRSGSSSRMCAIS